MRTTELGDVHDYPCHCGCVEWRLVGRYKNSKRPSDTVLSCAACGWGVTLHWLDGYWYGRWEESEHPGSFEGFLAERVGGCATMRTPPTERSPH